MARRGGHKHDWVDVTKPFDIGKRYECRDCGALVDRGGIGMDGSRYPDDVVTRVKSGSMMSGGRSTFTHVPDSQLPGAGGKKTHVHS
ncbi:MAG: hypothetical protein MPK62_00195 [Alphaproteobacteria bacterium]|nr:hypothetical protein [Alphaproteobacteria bacterium]